MDNNLIKLLTLVQSKNKNDTEIAKYFRSQGKKVDNAKNPQRQGLQAHEVKMYVPRRSTNVNENIMPNPIRKHMHIVNSQDKLELPLKRIREA